MTGIDVNDKRVACDSCHSRKLKCDKEDPCARCVSYKQQCLRTRPRKVAAPRPTKEARYRTIVERLAILEKEVTSKIGEDYSSEQGQHIEAVNNSTASTPVLTPDQSTPGQHSDILSTKRRRTSIESGSYSKGSGQAQRIRSSSSGHPPNLAVNLEARQVITSTLGGNAYLSQQRRDVLVSALSLVKDMSRGSEQPIADPITDILESSDSCEMSDPPTIEFLLSVIKGNSQHLPAMKQFPDHLLGSTIERMGLALLSHTLDANTTLYYTVCVSYKAYTYITEEMTSVENQVMKDYLNRARAKYLRNIMWALNRVSFMCRPSLALLQCLVTACLMMQMHGKSSSAWQFNSYASQVCIALGYHNALDHITDPQTKAEIYRAVDFTMMMDANLSMCFDRAPSLPVVDQGRYNMPRRLGDDIQGGLRTFVQCLVEFGSIQREFLELKALESPDRLSNIYCQKAQSLSKKLHDAYAHYQEVKKEPPHSTDVYLKTQWMTGDFTFYAIQCSMERGNPYLNEMPERMEQCLISARSSLLALLPIMDRYRISQTCHVVEGYPYFLSWTLLLFPLSPIFVLFCNIVCCSDREDFTLLQDITRGLSVFASRTRPVERLHKLCQTLVELSTPLVSSQVSTNLSVVDDASLSAGLGTDQESRRSNAISQANNYINSNMTSSHANNYGNLYSTQATSADGQLPVTTDMSSSSSTMPSLWGDSLMWRVFESQPTFGWFEAGNTHVPMDIELI